MQVKAITKYVYKGVEYNTLQDIQDTIHDTIGKEVIDKINRACPPQKHKDLFNMLEVLCQPEVRKILKECYNVTFERVKEPNTIDDYYNEETETFNILDI